MELIDLFIVALIAFIAGFRISSWIHVESTKSLLEALNVSTSDLIRVAKEKGIDLGKYNEADDEESTPTRSTLEIKVEEHKGQYYAFELERDAFIAQGKTTDELLAEILKKNPVGVNVVCDRDNGGDMLIGAVERLKARNQE